MVQFKDVSKVYKDGTTAVKDIDFVIEEGEFVFLIGPSGSGKTTLIQLLIRDQVPSKGKIFLDDEDITHISRNKVYKHRRNIGVIFQDYKLIEDKTAYENVEFAMEAAGKSDKEIRETVPYVLDIVGLGDRMDAFPVQLSGGEQQRVAIARAIANNPKLLIADEPTGNLDPASAWDIVQILTKINNWGTTVLMSTHGTDIVNTLNKRVLQMENGTLTRDDSEGQYEFRSQADPEKIKQIKEGIEGAENKKSGSGYRVNLSKEMEVEESSEEEAQDEESVVEQEESKEVEEVIEDEPKQRKGLFGRFFKKDDDSSESGDKEPVKDEQPKGVKETLEKAKEEEKNFEEDDGKNFADRMNKSVSEDEPIEKDKQKKDAPNEKESEEKEVEKMQKDDGKFHFKLSGFSGAGLAGNIDDEKKKSKKTKKGSAADSELNEFYEKNKNISVNFLNIPSKVIKDISNAGYSTVGDILDDGPEKLLETDVIDKDEVVLIAQAIEKLMEK